MTADIAVMLSLAGFVLLLSGFILLWRKRMRAYPVLLVAVLAEMADAVVRRDWLQLVFNMAAALVVLGLRRQRVLADSAARQDLADSGQVKEEATDV